VDLLRKAFGGYFQNPYCVLIIGSCKVLSTRWAHVGTPKKLQRPFWRKRALSSAPLGNADFTIEL